MGSRRNIGIIPIISGMVIIVVVAFLVYVLPAIMQPTTYLKLGDGIFDAKIVTTEIDRQKGLGGVTRLNSNQALLMIFPDQQKWGIWMKDMKIPIDIVWLDGDKKVVYAVTDISPETSTSKVFVPKLPARYVIELPAGTVNGKAITVNSTAEFTINKVIDIQ